MEKKLPTHRQIPGKNAGTRNFEASVAPKPLSLDERLEAFDPAKHGGEYMPAKPVGREVIPH